MAILLIAEHDNSTLSDQTAKALSAAAQMGGDVDVLVAGKGAQSAADAAAKLAGVRKVLLAESDALAERLAEPLADTIVKLADGYDALVAPATTMGKNVMPRVAALLDVMQISDIVEVVSADTFKDERNPRAEPYYRVTVRVNKADFTERQQTIEIRPGMRATAELQTGSKTVLQYLLKPLYKSREALREP